jgi:hypothetical protein
MVIRFDGTPRPRLLPLFDRLQQPREMPRSRRLTPREIAHRERMLQHLRSLAARDEGGRQRLRA